MAKRTAPQWRDLYGRETQTGPLCAYTQYLILNSRLTQSPVVLLNRIRAHGPRYVTARPRHFSRTTRNRVKTGRRVR